MDNQLTGKIFWVTDIFNDSGEKNYEHSSSVIENIIIDNDEDGYMIKFHIPYNEYFGKFYNVNLIRKDVGFEYESLKIDLQITCEKFQNNEKFFLFGKWNEVINYKWWAIIKK